MRSLYTFLAVALGFTCSAAEPCCPNHESKGSEVATAWLPPEKRAPSKLDFTFTDQDGRRVALTNLRGAPLAMSFVFTRCQNERKCPLVARTMAKLQHQLGKTNITTKPVLLLVTYDPEFDTPSVLKQFAETHDLEPGPTALLLRPDPRDKKDFFRRLNVGVNYNRNTVNLHGVQLLLFDKRGRHVRTHHSVIWDNASVIADLAALSIE